jgi:hypothetical protein
MPQVPRRPAIIPMTEAGHPTGCSTRGRRVALERRGTGLYLYESVRTGTRVRKRYVACGYLATLCDRWERLHDEQRNLDRWAREDRLDRFRRRAQRVRDVLDRATRLAADALHAAGWHTHHYEWRKQRGIMTNDIAPVIPTWLPHELAAKAGPIDPVMAEKVGKGYWSATIE